ncbi:hypothetical protein FJT64_009884 [Amphibalanus amphitrite]|uniref:Uncharacterized protein n=1 Tax=Amphibalanus amphitrite TaxID=1232801 RepID=A0A6A4VMY5_AMPAM|nr:hypothetical protein FJT64_009884 [Amphibalanus amphitrite]
MLYLTPVKPWCPVPFNETGRRCLGLVLVLLCMVGLLLTAGVFIMSIDVACIMYRFRYFYPPSEHMFRPPAIAMIHAAIHVAVYIWFAVACYHTSRWQTRARFNEYISVMVFGFLVMSICEHEIYVALYRGVRDWVHTLGDKIDDAIFFYRYSDEARAEVDRLQSENRCCGGSAIWVWHIIDWVGLQDEDYLPPKVQRELHSRSWRAERTLQQHLFLRSLSRRIVETLANRSIDICFNCPTIRPWSCCNPDMNDHRCLPSPGQARTWEVYRHMKMHAVNCSVGVYVTRFYDTMLDWGAVAEVMCWLNLLIALLAKYLDSASNEAMISGFPDGPSRGYLMQRCCGWFCPKPGFMPERPPPAAITYRPEEATSGIFGATDEGLERQLDEQLEREVEQKKEWRKGMREQRRQDIIDRKAAKHREKMGLLDSDATEGDDDDEEMDRGVDDEAEVVEENDDWAGD